MEFMSFYILTTVNFEPWTLQPEYLQIVQNNKDREDVLGKREVFSVIGQFVNWDFTLQNERGV